MRPCGGVEHGLIQQRQDAQPGPMASDSDQRATAQLLLVVIKYKKDIFANAGRTHIIEPQLDHTGQSDAGLKEQLREIKILSQHHGSVLMRPPHDFRVRGIDRTKLAPVAGRMAVLQKVGGPGDGQAVIDDNGQAGCSSISRSRVSQVA